MGTIKHIDCFAEPEIHEVNIPITFDGRTVTIPATTLTLLGVTYSMAEDIYTIPSPVPDTLRIYVVLHNGVLQYFVDAPTGGAPLFSFSAQKTYKLLMLLVSASSSELTQENLNVHRLIAQPVIP